MPQLRDAFVDVAKASSPSAASSSIVSETTFYLQSMQHLLELNLRYFPQSGKSQKEVVAATAARVGLQMPKKFQDPPKA